MPHFLLSLIGWLILIAWGTGWAGTPTAPQGEPISDYAGLVEHLRTAGLTVIPAGTITEPFFNVPGQAITVNRQRVEVFEYHDEAAAKRAAQTVSRNGEQVGNAIVDWVATPHFYQKGRLIVLYVGDDATVKRTLEAVLGPQFAGG
jgi:hypothetical protein